MSRQTERYTARKAAKSALPKGPSGLRPQQFMPPMPGFPNGVLATRANRNRAFHLAAAAFRRAKRPQKKVGDRTFVLHETKGWQSVKIAA